MQLTALLRRHGLEPREIVGLMVQRKRGALPFAEFSRKVAMQRSADTSILCRGHAVKPAL